MSVAAMRAVAPRMASETAARETVSARYRGRRQGQDQEECCTARCEVTFPAGCVLMAWRPNSPSPLPHRPTRLQREDGLARRGHRDVCALAASPPIEVPHERLRPQVAVARRPDLLQQAEGGAGVAGLGLGFQEGP